MNKNVLITGAKGQLGSEIHELAGVFPQFRFVFTDIDSLNLTDKDEVFAFFRENEFAYLINCSAYTAVDKAEEEEALCYQVNRDAVVNLAEAAKGRCRIIHISTDYVFSGDGDSPLKESDPVNPQSVYGRSKLAGEKALMERLPDDSIIIRTAWLYSVFGNNFVKTMIRLGREREALNVVNDQQGTPTYARDLALAILNILTFADESKTFPAGIYHYSDEGVCSWYEFCLKIHQLAGITCRVTPVPTADYPTKAKRPMYSVLDKEKIKTTFNLTIPDWESSLRDCLDKLNGI